MSGFELFALTLWAGAVGYYIGQSRGLERGRRESTVRVTGKDVSIVLEWRGIERILDHRGLIAMPKGVEFAGRKESACN
jgi:hypothetical protein